MRVNGYKGPRYVLGLDPGKITGYSLYDTELNSLYALQWSYEAIGGEVESTLVNHLDIVLSVEEFIISMQTAKNSQAPWSLELIGVFKYLAAKYNAPLKIQKRSAALPPTGLITNERLKALGWYCPGKGHANDASRYTALYLVQNGWQHPAFIPSE